MTVQASFTKVCIVCRRIHTITVDADRFHRWQGGEHIQSVWPEMTPDDREVLISGTCPECWAKLWPDDEE